MGVSRKLRRWFLGRAVDGRTELGGAMVRGLVSCAILGATALSFNLIVAAPSGAAGPLSTWLSMNGQIEKAGTGTFGWANSGTGAANSCPSTPAGAVNLNGTGGLFNCGSPDGAFNPNPALPTAAALAATGTAEGDILPGSQTFIADPANTETTQGCVSGGDRTGFVGGTKFGDNSGSYGLTQGAVTPAKDDMSDAYLVARTQSASDPSPGDKELYFGVERIKTNGDTTVDVEFTQQGASLGGTCGKSTLNVPRTQGDFALEFDWVNGGSVPAPVFFVWSCAPVQPVGTPCAAGNGAYVTTPLPASDIVLAENTAGTDPCGGWVCRNDSGVTTTVPQFGFAEGGIDLTAAGVGATCASTVLLDDHSATTNGGPADQHDLVGPAAFSTCPSPPMKTTPSQTSGSGGTLGGSWSDTATLTAVPPAGAPTGHVTFYSCSPSVLAAHSATTCSNAIGTQIPGTGSFPNPATLTPGATTSTATSPPITPDAVGTWCFAGYYGGETGVYAASSDATSDECFTVNPAPSTTTTQNSLIESGPGSIVIAPNGSWTDTAKVVGNSSGGAPTGTVTFYACGPTSGDALCTSSTWTQVGTGPVDLTTGANDTSTAPSASFGPPGKVGTYCFAAVYTPADGSNYSGSTDNTTGNSVDSNECVDVTPAHSTTTTQQSTSASGTGSINLGGSITDLATVTGNPAGGAPTGTVTFTVCGPTTSASPCADGQSVGTEPVGLTKGSGDASTATSPAYTPTAVGLYCFAAVYNPDGSANYLTSADNVSGDVQASECFLVTRADFKVLKADTPGNGNPVTPGSTIPYTITIQNIGNGGGSATIQDSLPSYLTIQGSPTCAVTGSDSCTVTNPSGSTWQFDVTLAPGDSATVTFSATLAATDTADDVNTATITHGNCDNGQAPADRSHAAVDNCSSTVTNPVPDYTVTKTDVPGNKQGVTPGATIPYTVAIKNVGDGMDPATITDTLPSVLTIQGTPQCAVTGSDTCKVTNTTGSTWTFDVNLAPGDTATVTFSAVLATSATGTVVNTATITAGPCNTSAGCASTVSNPIIVTAPTTTTTAPPVVKPAVIAFTGADIAAMVASALALLGLGGFLVLISRRRRQDEGHRA